MSQLLDARIQAWRQQLQDHLHGLLDFAGEAGNATIRETLETLIARSQDPFLFVVVGEVKAGKSSFINALLGSAEEICEVAPQPMTDCIQQVVYGPAPKSTQVNPHFRIVEQPIEILRDFAVVDTPGTNTIIEHHQEITERFVPIADLIIFVFEAKNPYRQSSWDFFQTIRSEWHKKVLFVLQQKDLLPAEDLAVNQKGVQDHARKAGIADPLVFAVSALHERTGAPASSGFSVLRSYIQDHVTGGQAPLRKMISLLDTATGVLERIGSGIGDRHRQWQEDRDFRNRIEQHLDQQRSLSEEQVGVLIAEILAAYQSIADDTDRELAGGLRFGAVLNRTLAGMFNRDARLQHWLQEVVNRLESRLRTDLKSRLDRQILDVAERIQQMARVVELEIRQSPTILPHDHEIFSDIADRRAAVLEELLTSFTHFMERNESFLPEDLFSGSRQMAPNVATGSGVAVVGVVLAAVTKGMVFDITGGVLTGLGILFAGITFGFQRKAILKRYREEMNQGKAALETELSEKLYHYVSVIRRRIASNFDSFDLHLQREEDVIQRLLSTQDKLTHRNTGLHDEISGELH